MTGNAFKKSHFLKSIRTREVWYVYMDQLVPCKDSVHPSLISELLWQWWILRSPSVSVFIFIFHTFQSNPVFNVGKPSISQQGLCTIAEYFVLCHFFNVFEFQPFPTALGGTRHVLRSASQRYTGRTSTTVCSQDNTLPWQRASVAASEHGSLTIWRRTLSRSVVKGLSMLCLSGELIEGLERECTNSNFTHTSSAEVRSRTRLRGVLFLKCHEKGRKLSRFPHFPSFDGYKLLSFSEGYLRRRRHRVYLKDFFFSTESFFTMKDNLV